MVFELPNLKKKHKADKPKPKRLYRNPIALAQEWKKATEDRDCSSPVGLARKLRVSLARVTQVLRLLSLSPEVLKAIAALRATPYPPPSSLNEGSDPSLACQRRSRKEDSTPYYKTLVTDNL